MALVLADRVKETTTTSGSGSVTLDGASAGFQSFAAIGDGNTTYYTIAAQTGNQWEVGIGTYTSSGTTLSRTTILSNSAGTQPTQLNFSAGTKDVFVTYPAEYAVTATNAVGTTGQVLTSNGSGVSPSFQTPSVAPSTILENAQTISSNYTITNGYNGLSVGPVTVASGVTVTVGSGQRWLVL
jgi:hypothetical protein